MTEDTRGSSDVQPDDKPTETPPVQPGPDAEREEWKQWRKDMDEWRKKHDDAHKPADPPPPLADDETVVEQRTDPPPVKPDDTKPPAEPGERHAGMFF